MNACEIEFAKSISSSDDNQRRLIKEQIGEKMYNELMAGGSNSASSNSNLSLRDFFDFGNGRNGSLYERTRSMTISKIKAKLFNDYENPNGFVATTDKQLDLAFKSLISSLKSKRGYRENPNQKVWDLYKILDDPSYRNPDFISDYFIINHLDIVINNWMKDLISKRGNNFIYKPKHEIRVDWDSDKFDKKEPDLSALVSSLLRDTIVNKYVGNKVVKGKFFITQTSFMTAASIIFNQLDYKTMQEVVENPYKIIDVLKKRYSNNKSWSLEDNILRSFCEKWLLKNDEDQFFLASFKNNNKYVQILFSPLDVFVHSFSKYVVNTYLDYDVENGKITKLSTSVDTGDLTSDIYVQICSNIELSDLSAYDKLFKKNNTKFDVADISEVHNFRKQISKQAKHQLDSLLGIDITNFEQANMILHAIADYHNSNGKNTFQDFIKDWRPSARIKTNESPTTFIRDAVRLEYASNPTIILGSKKNVAGTSLPTFGIESLASDIRKAVAINDLHKRQIGFNGKTIYEHGFLYKEITEDTGMFKGTSYPDIIFVDGVSKETSNLSTYEAFKMAFVYNWYNGWHSEDGSFYIQAITPSDKPKIPWFEFDAKKFKDKFTSNGKLNKAMIMSQLHLMYKQYLLNSINDFSRVLGFKTFDQDAANVNLEDIKTRIIEINALKLSVDDINNKVRDYNIINNSNIIIAQHADYIANKNGAISFNNFILEYVENTNDESYYLSNFLNDLKDLSKDMPSISWMYKNEEHSLDFEKLSKYDIETLRKEIKNNKDLSSLYDYFLIQCLCSDNILANTVGFQFQHKNVKEGFKDNDSQSHITMVKRMVAMTATAHNMMPGVLSGQPDQMRMMIIKNGKKEMITHSGKSTSGDNPIDELKVSDGVMYSTRISDTLSKQSIADVKPYGNALKYICHDYRVDKGSSTLLKLASDSIDNAYLRQFSYGNLSDSDPLSIIKLQLEDGHIKPEISVAGDKIIGINGAPVALFRHRYKKNGVIYTVGNLRFINNRFYVTVQASNRDGAYEESCDNNLWSLWNNLLGGQFSCDNKGNYDESSMDFIINMLNVVGEVTNKNGEVFSQNDVDQYLKKQIIMFFPTEEGSKSLKIPSVSMGEAVKDPSKKNTFLISCHNFGIQLDPDHEIANSRIHEITQLMSYLAEKGLVPEKTKKIYRSIVKLINILSSETFISKEQLLDKENRAEYRRRINEIFSKKIINIFSDPSLSVVSLANAICSELQKLNRSDLFPPISDHQILMKAHTTVGSYFNKFIARSWTGTGDVLMASDMCKVLEDENGIAYFANDKKYLVDDNGNVVSSMPIKEYLDDIQFETLEKTNEFGEKLYLKIPNRKLQVSKYELEPYLSYYMLNGETGEYNLITINTNSDMMYYTSLTNVAFFKALNVPRRLKTANRVISNGVHKLNLWHLKCQQELIKFGKLLSEFKKDNSSIEVAKFMEENFPDSYGLAENILTELKNNALKRYESVLNILSKIYSYNKNNEPVSLSPDEILALENELPEDLLINGPINVENLTYTVYPDEKLSTNYTAGIYGESEMVLSDILQKGKSWFKENLRVRCCNKVNNDLTHLYTANGNMLVILKDGFNKADYTKVSIETDEDGYVYNESTGLRYKLPQGATIYTKEINGSKVEFVHTNDDSVKEIIRNGSFIFYRGNVDLGQEMLRINNEKDLDIAANKQWITFQKSLEHMVSRIPAQALAFGMPMKTVGFLPWTNNVSMVNDMHVYLEGSDYDIDKIYAMSLSIMSNGVENKGYINNVFTTDKDINNEASIDINRRLALYVYNEMLLNGQQTKNTTKESIVSDIIYLLKNQDVDLNINWIKNEVATLAEANNVSSDEFKKHHVNQYINDIISEIRVNQSIKLLRRGTFDGVQNMMLLDIIDIYKDPRTLLAQTTPTTMAPVKNAVKSLKKDNIIRPHHSITTNIRLNKTTIVGKAGVGITANGQKVGYAVEYYNQQMYNNNEVMCDSGYSLKIAKSMRWDENVSEFGYIIHPGAKINDVTINHLINLVSKTKNNKLKIGHYTLDVSEGFLRINKTPIKAGDIVNNFSPTDIISSLISSCTDNAKEMDIDLLNGSDETLSGYIFLVLLGMDLNQASKIIGSDIVMKLINEVRGDYFNKNTERVTMLDKINDLLGDENKLNTFIEKHGLNDNKHVGDELKTLQQVFRGAKAITNISRVLKINGGIEVDFGKETLFRYNIGDVMGLSGDFDLYNFLYGYKDPQGVISEYSTKSQECKLFNIVKIVNTVDHYREMLKVPLMFENEMRALSSDYDLVVKIANLARSWDYKISSDLDLRNIAAYVNDVKICDFLLSLDFEYNGTNISNEENNFEALTSFKRYVEKNIFPKIKQLYYSEEYSDNLFVSSLIMDNKIMKLFNTKTKIIKTMINVNNEKDPDSALSIKDDFYKIQDIEIKGHTIYEWLFLYNLMCSKHALGKNNLATIFDDKLDFNEDSLIYKWNKFINDYDNSNIELDFKEDLPYLGLEKNTNREADEEYYYDYIEVDPDEGSMYQEKYNTAMYIDPNKFPLYISKSKIGLPINIKDYSFIQAFRSGIIFIKHC